MNNNIKEIKDESHFICGEINNNFIYFEILSEKKQKIIFINGKKFKSEEYINDFFWHIINSFPKIDNEYNERFFSNYFELDSNFSRKKNYFVNKLDREIQNHLGLNPISISQFTQNDRVFLKNNKNTYPQLDTNILKNKIVDKNYSEVIYLLKNIYLINDIKKVNAIYSKYIKNTFIDSSFPLLIYLELFYELNQKHTNLNIYKVQKLKEFIDLLIILIIEISSKDDINKLLFKEIIIMDLYLISNVIKNYKEHSLNYLKENITIILEGISSLITFLSKKDIFQFIILEKDSICFKIKIIKKHIETFESDLKKIHINKENNDTSESSLKLIEKFSISKQPEWGQLFRTPNEIMEIESNSKSFWMVTPDFYFELQNYSDYFENLIIANLDQGKTFKYFYAPESRSFAKQVQNKYKSLNRKGNVTFNEIKELSNFFMLFDYEIILYDPEYPNSKYHSGFFTDFFKQKETISTLKPISIVHTMLSKEKMKMLIEILSKY
jgi:hypothetical protein